MTTRTFALPDGSNTGETRPYQPDRCQPKYDLIWTENKKSSSKITLYLWGHDNCPHIYRGPHKVMRFQSKVPIMY